MWAAGPLSTAGGHMQAGPAHSMHAQLTGRGRRGFTFKLGSAGPVLSIVKEASSLFQHQLQLHELTVALLQALTVAVDLQQLRLQFIQLCLQV